MREITLRIDDDISVTNCSFTDMLGIHAEHVRPAAAHTVRQGTYEPPLLHMTKGVSNAEKS